MSLPRPPGAAVFLRQQDCRCSVTNIGKPQGASGPLKPSNRGGAFGSPRFDHIRRRGAAAMAAPSASAPACSGPSATASTAAASTGAEVVIRFAGPPPCCRLSLHGRPTVAHRTARNGRVSLLRRVSAAQPDPRAVTAAPPCRGAGCDGGDRGGGGGGPVQLRGLSPSRRLGHRLPAAVFGPAPFA